MSNVEKRRAIFDKHRCNADLLILQETHSTPEQEKIWQNEWGGKIIFSHGTSAARGVMICIKKEIIQNVQNIFTDEDGRIVIVDYKESEKVITIVAIYAPNEDSPNFFIKIGKLIAERSEHKIIVGDFNLVLDVELDRCNTYCNNNRAKEELENLSEEYSLRDIWRLQNENKREFSWIKRNSYPTKASRIDYAMVSGGMDQMVKTTQYITSYQTDHRAFYMCIDLINYDRGIGYWKFNNELLNNKGYVIMIQTEISKTIECCIGKDVLDSWEILKYRIKQATISFAKGKSSEDKIVIGQLSEKVDDYESRLPLTQEETQLLEKTKIELEEKVFDRTKAVMFRSKARWYELGEKNSKYFYQLEKTKYNSKTCYKILKENGQEIDNPKQILEEQKKFYSELYEEDDFVEFTMQNHYGVKVPLQIKEQQNLQISIQELGKALLGMKNNKTPGEDGLSADFYKFFWKNIKELFYQVVLKCYENKELHKSASRGILNLIPKPGKDSRYIKNLRPITLLNTDYKIIEKAIANKMIPALETIIHKDQRGFMENRRISVNIRKMLDIMHQVEEDDLEAVIVSMDFVKCFDKCSFKILHGSLQFFEFGEKVRVWTKILYNNFSVKIQNNGYFSKAIEIRKGVHQGGCCSSIYFLVIAEILALALRENENIDGITLKEIRNLLNQFADDMDIFSICNQKSLYAIRDELEKFRLQSGFTVSYDKTTIYRIGSLQHSNARLYSMNDFEWSNEDISVLGVTIAHTDIVQKNYQDIVSKVKKTLNLWYNRDLSLIGKIQVVNTLVASLFVYKMMVLPIIPINIVKQVDNLIREFIWNGKKSKIAYKILQQSKQQGGLNLVNLVRKDKALKATWPKILSQERKYATLVYSIMRCSSLEENIWRCSIAPEDVVNIRIKNQFWRDTLKSWCEYNFFYEVRIENQLIWYNSRIRVKEKPFFWGDSYKHGLK